MRHPQTRARIRSHGPAPTLAFLLAVTIALLTGCGGSAAKLGASPSGQRNGESTPQSTHATSSSTAAPARARPAGGGTSAGSTAPVAAAERCVNQGNGNPADVMICLADHGVKLGDDPQVLTCLQAATSAGAVDDCLARVTP